MLYNVYHAPTTKEEDVFIPELFRFAYQVEADTLGEVYESTNFKGFDEPVQKTGDRIKMIGVRSTSVGDVIVEHSGIFCLRKVYMVAKVGFVAIDVHSDRFDSPNVVSTMMINGESLDDLFSATPDEVKGYTLETRCIPAVEVAVGDIYLINGKDAVVTGSEVMTLGESKTVIHEQWVLSFDGISIPFKSNQFLTVRRRNAV